VSIALAALAAAFLWAALVTGLAATMPVGLFAGLGGVAAAVPVLLSLAPRAAVLGRLGAIALALYPVVFVLALLIGQPGAEDLTLWPAFLAALAAGLALLPPGPGGHRAASDSPALGLLPLGMATLVAGVTLAATAGRLPQWPDRLTAAAYLSLYAAACVIAVGLTEAILAGRLTARRDRFLRAMIGLLPLLGFAGTILGIMQALSRLPDVIDPAGGQTAGLQGLLGGLATAFETTLIGVIAAVIAGLILTLLQDSQSDAG